MNRLFLYSHGMQDKKLVAFEDHPESLRKFETEFNTNNRRYVKVRVVLRTDGCRNEGACIKSCQISRSPVIKVFRFGNQISIYLKVDEESVSRIPEGLIHHEFYSHLLSRYRKKNTFDSAEHLDDLVELTGKESDHSDEYDSDHSDGSDKIETPRRDGLGDASGFLEAEIPAGLKLDLRVYQKKSISWMKSIESIKSNRSNTILHYPLAKVKNSPIKFKLGDTHFYLGKYCLERGISAPPHSEKREALRFYGGILADDTGSGKTITTLGLIHSAPFTQEHQINRTKRFKDLLDNRIQSRASCIICPSNICRQWVQEAQRCNPSFKVYGISSMTDHLKVSWRDVVEADIVVVSYQFLMSVAYMTVGSGLVSAVDEWADYADVKGRVVLDDFHFYRVLFDEFHELTTFDKRICYDSRYCSFADIEHSLQSVVGCLQADNFWGLTGTPKLDPLIDISYLTPSQALRDLYTKNTTIREKIIRKHVKRNVPNLQLPELQNEIVWVDFSAHELNVMRWKSYRSNSTMQQIMLCTHYQLNVEESIRVENFVSVSEAYKRLSLKKAHEIEQLKRKKVTIQSMLEKEEASDHSSSTSSVQNCQGNLSHWSQSLKAVESELKSSESSLVYFRSVFQVISEPDKNDCGICFENIGKGSLSILPCSHVFCYDCIGPFVYKSRACPLCRQIISNFSDVFRIRIRESVTLPPNLENLDSSKYSSKLISMYRYVTELIETDKTARIILFLQYSDLAKFIAKTFTELQVEFVRVAGHGSQRQNSIAKFRSSPDIRLIMMSAEDSVSGINLTQATHVILLHPFYTGEGESVDLAYEKQGISRAYRFGLDHPLKVVRFAVRGTVEEQITLARKNIKIDIA